jgi:hypothetical protein
MKVHRLWIEIVLVGATLACTLALLIATLGAAGEAAVDVFAQARTAKPVRQEVLEGMVTCSRCGARHSARLGQSAAACVRICVHGGASFALVDGDKVYLLDGNLDLLKKAAGQRMRVTGVIDGNTIRVISVMAADG